MVVLLAMELLDMEDVDDVPEESASIDEQDEDRREKFFRTLCRTIVSHCWSAVPQDEVDSVSSCDPVFPKMYNAEMMPLKYMYCTCKEGKI